MAGEGSGSVETSSRTSSFINYLEDGGGGGERRTVSHSSVLNIGTPVLQSKISPKLESFAIRAGKSTRSLPTDMLTDNLLLPTSTSMRSQNFSRNLDFIECGVLGERLEVTFNEAQDDEADDDEEAALLQDAARLKACNEQGETDRLAATKIL